MPCHNAHVTPFMPCYKAHVAILCILPGIQYRHYAHNISVMYMPLCLFNCRYIMLLPCREAPWQGEGAALQPSGGHCPFQGKVRMQLGCVEHSGAPRCNCGTGIPNQKIMNTRFGS